MATVSDAGRYAAGACLLLAAATLAAAAGEPGAGRYVETRTYVSAAFDGAAPPPATLWVGGELRQSLQRVLGHEFNALRVRYWYDGKTSVWVLDEIGKELPITIGVSVADDGIREVRVLAFRESRGWEVRYPFFTDQFRGTRLDDDARLDRDIDGITGATLSVAAVTRITRVALLMHAEIRDK